MKIKKGDTVIVTTGKDRGKTGEVIKAMPKDSKVVVDGINMAKKHMKPTQNTPGQIIEMARPIHVSNVMIYDKESKTKSRVGKKLVDGKYVRIAKKTGNRI